MIKRMISSMLVVLSLVQGTVPKLIGNVWMDKNVESKRMEYNKEFSSNVERKLSIYEFLVIDKEDNPLEQVTIKINGEMKKDKEGGSLESSLESNLGSNEIESEVESVESTGEGSKEDSLEGSIESTEESSEEKIEDSLEGSVESSEKKIGDSFSGSIEGTEESSEEEIEDSLESSTEFTSSSETVTQPWEESVPQVDGIVIEDEITTDVFGYAYSNQIKEALEQGYTIKGEITYTITCKEFATIKGTRLNETESYEPDLLYIGFEKNMEEIVYSYEGEYTLPVDFIHDTLTYSIIQENTLPESEMDASKKVMHNEEIVTSNEIISINEKSGTITIKRPGTVWIQAEAMINGRYLIDRFCLTIVKGQRQILYIPHIPWNEQGEIDVYYGCKQLENPIYMVVDKNNEAILYDEVEKIRYTSQSEDAVGSVNRQGVITFSSGKQGQMVVKASLEEDDYYKETEIFYTINVNPYHIYNIENYIQINGKSPIPNQWYDESLQVTISDEIGEYEISTTNHLTENTWNEAFIIDEECISKDLSIYVKNKQTGAITNEVIIPANEIQIDTTAPQMVEVSYSKPVFSTNIWENTFQYYNKNVCVTIKVKDVGSGIGQLYYSKNEMGEDGQTLKYQLPITEGSKEVEKTFVIESQYKGFLTIETYDLAGNQMVYGQRENKTEIIVDSNPPQLKIQYVGKKVESETVKKVQKETLLLEEEAKRQGLVFEEKVLIQLDMVEENFYPEDVSIFIKKDSERKAMDISWVESTRDCYKATISLEEEGVYELSIYYKDRSNNEMQWYCKTPDTESRERGGYSETIIIKPYEIVQESKPTEDMKESTQLASEEVEESTEIEENTQIDKEEIVEETKESFSQENPVGTEAPSLSINVFQASNIVENIYYYNTNAHGEVEIKGDMMDYSKVLVEVNQTPIHISHWEKRSNKMVGSFTLEDEGSYTVVAKYRKSDDTILHTTSPKLIIDKTSPTIELYGMNHQSANNQIENIGFYAMIEDDYIDKESIEIELLGTFRNEKGEFYTKTISDGKIQELIIGKKYKYEIQNLQEDGYYELLCSVKDLAGNKASSVRVNGDTQNKEIGENAIIEQVQTDKVEFSINRKGSVFQLGEYTKQVMEYYYVQEIKEDIEIAEVNADVLQSYSLTLNGKLLQEGVDYTVEKNNKKETWNRYTYKVKKELFLEDGEYILTVTSLDNANNQGYSDIKDGNVQFVVDKKPPTITYSGLAENGIYQGEEQIVTLSPTDFGGKLQLITVEIFDEVNRLVSMPISLKGEELLNQLKENNVLQFSLKEGEHQTIRLIAKDSSIGTNSDGNKTDIVISNVSVVSKKAEYPILEAIQTPVLEAIKVLKESEENKKGVMIAVSGIMVGVSVFLVYLVRKNRKR